MANLELEQAVIMRLSGTMFNRPCFFLAVMKADLPNSIVISKAGAVKLMQLVPETAIRHGVRNPYDTNKNITGVAKSTRVTS